MLLMPIAARSGDDSQGGAGRGGKREEARPSRPNVKPRMPRVDIWDDANYHGAVLRVWGRLSVLTEYGIGTQV